MRAGTAHNFNVKELASNLKNNLFALHFRLNSAAAETLARNYVGWP
jgi:hypothetical protein